MFQNQYIPFLCTCGCGNHPSNCRKILTSEIAYSGPALGCIPVTCNMPLNEILAQMAIMICNAATTTSTTSSTSTTTSTTSTTSTTTSTSTSTSTTTTTTTIPNCRHIEMVVVQELQDAPTFTVLETNFTPSLSITTQRLGVGQYLITFTGPNVPAMNNNTTLVLTGTNNQSVSTFVNLNELYLYTYLADGLTPADEVLANPFSIYIKHCNALPII